MAKVVFILGAGASVDAGAPLMNDFIDRAEALFATNQIEAKSRDAFELAFRGLTELQGTAAKADIDQDNLESVFAAFEMAKLLQKLGNLDDSDIDQLPAAMRSVIEETLVQLVKYAIDGAGKPLFPGFYDKFMGALEALREGPDPVSVGIVTFNYDLALDYALWLQGIPFTYCLSGPAKPASQEVRYLKLHGSLGWGVCPDCKEIVPRESFVPTIRADGARIRNGTKQKMTYRTNFDLLKHGSHSPTNGPFIVPPTWSKGEHHVQISKVWRAAAAELASAEHIFVAGYSLPDSDQFFKHLFAIGAQGAGRIKDFTVLDPNIQAVAKRVSSFLGPNVRSRLKTFDVSFKDAAGMMQVLAERIATSSRH